MIRFFTNTTKATNSRLFGKCICGEDNSGKHSLDECQRIMDYNIRERYIEKGLELLKTNNKHLLDKAERSLYEICCLIFFTIEEKKGIGKLVELMKEVIMKTVFNYKEEI